MCRELSCSLTRAGGGCPVGVPPGGPGSGAEALGQGVHEEGRWQSRPGAPVCCSPACPVAADTVFSPWWRRGRNVGPDSSQEGADSVAVFTVAGGSPLSRTEVTLQPPRDCAWCCVCSVVAGQGCPPGTSAGCQPGVSGGTGGVRVFDEGWLCPRVGPVSSGLPLTPWGLPGVPVPSGSYLWVASCSVSLLPPQGEAEQDHCGVTLSQKVPPLPTWPEALWGGGVAGLVLVAPVSVEGLVAAGALQVPAVLLCSGGRDQSE